MPFDSASPAVLAQRSISSRTIGALRTFFDCCGHRPSDDHWLALEAIADTMEAMLDGRCAPKVYLSPCDPGVGKTQTVVHFARELVGDDQCRDKGMLVSVFTIDEAKALAAHLASVCDSLCVLTSDPAANALGRADANEAQILITTQNRLGRLTEDRPFSSVTAFFYHGAPRACRVWDESVLPGSAIVVGADALIGMASRLRTLSPELVSALYRFGGELLQVEHGAAIDVPDFTAACGLSLYDLTSHLAADDGTTARQQDREVALSLLVINGRRVRVCRDGRSGSAVITFREELPADLPPMLVLDASGRVRETYALWQDSRDAIVLLPAATRDYSPLTIKMWRTSGAKSGWEARGDRLLAGIVVTIETKPDEDWLVVVHKSSGRIGDLERALKAKLPATVRDRVSVTTWGRHAGLNAWADVTNVILAGTLFYPASHLTALHHLCANLPVADGLVSKAEVERTARGEHRHLILQAVCRGRVRRSDGSRCQPMTAYIIASPRSGIPTELETIFPGCTVETWSPLKVEAKGKLGEAIAWLTEALEGGRSEVAYSEIRATVGLEPGNFAKRISKSDEWKATIDALGAEIIRGPRGALYVRLLAVDRDPGLSF
jgi:hypothetical protein